MLCALLKIILFDLLFLGYCNLCTVMFISQRLKSTYDIDYYSGRKDVIGSMHVLCFRGHSVENLYHLKAHAEYYPNIHFSSFNTSLSIFVL